MSNFHTFEQRKKDHIKLALAKQNEAIGQSGLDAIGLQHEAVPEIDFSEVSLQTQALGHDLPTPFCVSGMTAGHPEAEKINHILAQACQQHGWLMGVGSQRRQLTDPTAHIPWQQLRKIAPKVRLLGNLGLSQLITTPIADIQRLIAPLQPVGLCIHTNPLQECLQPEGTPHFRGGLQALTQLCHALEVPVILKETGCGFSKKTLQRLASTGLAAVDVSGLGGTHWGRIEGQRAPQASIQEAAAITFKDWGIPTVTSLLEAQTLSLPYAMWGSGGVRSGLDVAKLYALGAQVIGLARPMLTAALAGEAAVHQTMERMAYELRMALFCTGHAQLTTFQQDNLWYVKTNI